MICRHCHCELIYRNGTLVKDEMLGGGLAFCPKNDNYRHELSENYYRNEDCAQCARMKVQRNGICARCGWDNDKVEATGSSAFFGKRSGDVVEDPLPVCVACGSEINTFGQTCPDGNYCHWDAPELKRLLAEMQKQLPASPGGNGEFIVSALSPKVEATGSETPTGWIDVKVDLPPDRRDCEIICEAYFDGSQWRIQSQASFWRVK